MPTKDELLDDFQWEPNRELARRIGGDNLQAHKRHHATSLKEPPICDGCRVKGTHHCKKEVRVIDVDTTGTQMKVKRRFVKCSCAKCQKKK